MVALPQELKLFLRLFRQPAAMWPLGVLKTLILASQTLCLSVSLNLLTAKGKFFCVVEVPSPSVLVWQPWLCPPSFFPFLLYRNPRTGDPGLFCYLSLHTFRRHYRDIPFPGAPSSLQLYNAASSIREMWKKKRRTDFISYNNQTTFLVTLLYWGVSYSAWGSLASDFGLVLVKGWGWKTLLLVLLL